MSGKGTRFRTKMQVGPQPLGRNKPYAQVMVPHTGKFRSEDGERYYRHSKGARISKASHFDFDYELGHKIKFICVAKGSPRPSITWFKDGMEVYQHGYMHVRRNRMSQYYYSVRSSFASPCSVRPPRGETEHNRVVILPFEALFFDLAARAISACRLALIFTCCTYSCNLYSDSSGNFEPVLETKLHRHTPQLCV